MKNKTPLVSIIIPCYNYGRFLEDAMGSLIAQSYQNWECKLIDDGSTDETATIGPTLAQKDARIQYHHQQNAGLSAARNKGLSLATGKYIQFLDADDKLEANKIETQVIFLENHTEVDVVYGEVRYFRDDSDELFLNRNTANNDWMPKVSGQGTELLHHIIKSNILELGSALFRKTICDKNGLFGIDISALADWEFSLRSIHNGARFAFHATENGRILMRFHPESMSQVRLNMVLPQMLARKKMDGYLTDPEIKKINRTRYHNNMETVGLLEIEAGKRFSGCKRIIKSGFLKGHFKTIASGFLYLFVKPKKQQP